LLAQNVSVATRIPALVAVVALGLPAVSACGSGPPDGSPAPTLSPQLTEREQLSGLAAAAKDKRYVATYTLSTPKRPDRTVTVAVASDGTWVVAVPGGALGGLADIAMFRSGDGLFQCMISTSLNLLPGCVAVTGLTPATDPQIQHIFTDWIDALVDRTNALSVTDTALLPGASGSCYSVESNSAALAPPVDPGIYCYGNDGVLTAAKVSFGTLVLVGAVGAAPATVTRPGNVVSRPALTMTTPAPA
jgi:hypothetical protein